MRAIVLAVAAVVLAACGTDDPSVTAAQRDDIVVVAGLRPLAEIAERIGGDRVVAVNVTAVGESPHELVLTPRQREEVLAADLAVVIGGGFQPALERAAAAREGRTVSVVDALDLPAEPAGGHVWLDPTLLGSIATSIGDALAEVDPDGARGHRRRAESIVEEVVALDARIAAALASCERDVIVTQHDAFGWFAARYDLTAMALDEASPDADPAPDPERLAEVEAALDGGGILSLFTEPLQPPSWIEILAEERGLDTDVLNPYEGLTLGEDARDVTYEDVMLANLRTLRDHLDCAS